MDEDSYSSYDEFLNDMYEEYKDGTKLGYTYYYDLKKKTVEKREMCDVQF